MFFARSFDYTFAVNQVLVETDIRFFKIPAAKIIYLPNFSLTGLEDSRSTGEKIPLKGRKEDRLVCLANFRPQKDHLNLLTAFREVIDRKPLTQLYLIGVGNGDTCEREILEYIEINKLQENVHWLGGQMYPGEILRDCAIGVLPSESEGLPLALIEYGLNGLAVVSTAVGEVPALVANKQHGLLVPAKDPKALADAILFLLAEKEAARQMAVNLKRMMEKGYSATAVMEKVVLTYKNFGVKIRC